MSPPTNALSTNVPSSNYSEINTSSVSVYFGIDVFRLIASFFDNPKDVVHLGLVNKYHLKQLLPYAPLWDPFLRKYFPDSYARLKPHHESLVLYKRLTNAAHNMEGGKLSSSNS
jgi:hypothetical protein